MNEEEITTTQVDRLHDRLAEEAEAGGYHLNSDAESTKLLVRGLLTNERRYGYPACPCRLADGNKRDDLDIICPCDYRDADLSEYGACYCALYVSDDVIAGKRNVSSIPERRPPMERSRAAAKRGSQVTGLSLPVWRCRVCGYLCAREQPPDVCPICKAKKERFERFIEP